MPRFISLYRLSTTTRIESRLKSVSGQEIARSSVVIPTLVRFVERDPNSSTVSPTPFLADAAVTEIRFVSFWYRKIVCEIVFRSHAYADYLGLAYSLKV